MPANKTVFTMLKRIKAMKKLGSEVHGTRRNVRHQIKEEQGEIFPEVKKTNIDFLALGDANGGARSSPC